MIFRAVLDVSWRASCLILAVIALRSMLQVRLAARMLFWIWIAVAVRLLLPVALPTVWSPFNFVRFADRPGSGIAVGRDAKTAAARHTDSAATTATNSIARPRSLPAPRAKPTLAQWAALGWSAGVLALLVVRTWAYVRLVRTLRRSRAEPDPATAALLAEIARRMGFPEIDACVTGAVRTPALHGILRPTLLFPPGFLEKLTPHEIRLTVAHELAHDRRRDLHVQVLIHTAVIVHWFNPLAWIAARLARHDCELACDETVLRDLTATERESYGATLLKIVGLAHGVASPPLGLGVVESKQQLKRRIQMIAAQPSPTLARTLLGCALFALAVGLSLTAETLTQPAPSAAPARVPAEVRTVAAAEPAPARFAYDSFTDGLGVLFANGVVATVGDRVITVEDVRREMKPLVPQLQRQARDQDDFKQRINRLQNEIIQELIGRVLLIKEFHVPAEGEGAKHIPAEYIDNVIADAVKEQFDNDRTKLLAHLQARGVTMTEYRHEVEDDIIYHYMQSQLRNLDKKVNPSPAKSDGAEGEVHLRIIQLKRSAAETDAALLEKAKAILGRFKNGEAFEALAMKFDEDQRRDKGGDWGWQSPAGLKSEYREKLSTLKPGEVSAPIVTKEGCFLLYVEDRK